MPSTLAKKTFDYSSLDPETSLFVQQQTGEIRSLIKQTAQSIIEVGQKLFAVKQKLRHGQFLDWLDTEFAWHRDTANKFMHVAEHFSSLEMSKVSTFAPSALYILAAPSTPEPARQEALALAEAGEPITYTAAKHLKQKYTALAAQAKPDNLTAEEPEQPETREAESPLFSVHASENLPSLKGEPSPSQPEILAIRPKTVPEPENKRDAKQVFQSLLTRADPLLAPSKLVETGSWWKLGDKHLLYCGSPTSPRFLERLPRQVALSLAFPPQREDWQASLGPQINSALSLFTVHEDQDFSLLRLMVKNALELYTEERETVVFSFLPDSGLLLLADELGCCCFVAEPEPERCDRAIATWKQIGTTAEKVSGLRF